MSKKFSLNLSDLLHGLITAVLSPIVPMVLSSLNEGKLTFDPKGLGMVAIGAATGYLTKNFFSGSATPAPSNGK